MLRASTKLAENFVIAPEFLLLSCIPLFESIELLLSDWSMKVTFAQGLDERVEIELKQHWIVIRKRVV